MLAQLRKYRKKISTRHFLRQFIKTGDLCFDIGANVGELSTFMLELKGRVIAVEPQPECLKILQKLSGKYPHLVVIPKGVSDSAGQAPLHVCNMNEVSTLSQPFIDYYQRHDYLSWDQTITIELTTLDTLIETYGTPAFCKIDTEGWEIPVLSGLSQPIRYISFEYNKPFTEQALQCVTKMEALGEAVFNFVPYENMQFAFKTWQPAPVFKETFTKYAEDILTGDIYVHFPETAS